MKKAEKLKLLFENIFGQKIESFNFEFPLKSDFPIKGEINDKCSVCKSGTSACPSVAFRQDLPFYLNIENTDTMVIAEAPGKGIENGLLGSVFGLFKCYIEKDLSKTDKYYFNYFKKILKLDLENAYISDCLKCYTKKHDFNKSFKFCSSFLKREIEIINPKKIYWITKQVKVQSFIKQNSLESVSIIIPHPSKQNLSKIPTVAELFKSIGEIQGNDNLLAVSKSITAIYKNWREELEKDIVKNDKTIN